MNHSPFLRTARILSAAVAALPLAGAYSADILWDNEGSGSFTDNANWVGDVAPGLSDTAIIANGGTANVTEDVDVDSLRLDNGIINQATGTFTAFSTVTEPDEALRAFNIGSAAGQTGTYNASETAKLIGGGVRIGFDGGTGIVNLTGTASYEATDGKDTWLGNGVGSHGTLTIADDASWTATSAIVVGRAGGTGLLTMTGGQVIQTGNNTYLGDGAGTTSTVSLSNDAVLRNTSGEIWVGQGGAHTELTIADDAVVEATNNWIAVGRFANGASQGTVLIKDSGKLIKTGGGGEVVIGADAVGKVTLQDNATLSSNNQILVGEGDDADALIDLQGGTVSSGGDFVIGKGGGSVGKVTASGGTITAGGWTKLGFNAGASGEMVVSGTAQINTGGTFIVGDDGSGVLTMDGGTMNTTGETWVGQNGQGVGTFTLNDGTYTSGAWIAVGRDGALGTLNVNGGTLSHTGVGNVTGANLEGSNFVVNGSAEEVAVVTHTSGVINNTTSVLAIGQNTSNVSTWTASGGTANLGDLRVGFNGLGTLTIGGTADYSATSVYLSSNGGSTGHLILNGGSLTANFIEEGAGQGTIAFNGGTLRARQNAADFLPDFEAGDIQMQAGGLKFDTNGFDVGISHALTGEGGLTKLGTGTLTLSGATDFTGFSAVQAGVLEIGVGGALGGVPHLDIAAGAGLVVHETISLNENIVLTLVDGSALTLDFDGTMTVAALWINGSAVTPDTYTLDQLKALPGTVDFDGSNANALLTVTSTVPEPGTIALLSCGAAIALWRLRRRR